MKQSTFETIRTFSTLRHYSDFLKYYTKEPMQYCLSAIDVAVVAIK